MIAPGGIVGNAGGPYTTYQGAQNIHVDELHNQVINELFHLHTGVTSTIAVAVDAGDVSAQVTSDAAFNVNDVVQINNGQIETTFPIITAKPGGNVLQFDRPLDFSYAVDDVVEVVHTNLKTTIGTLAAPIIHRVQPEPGKIWFINRILLTMTHPAAAADNLFGSLAALTNGVVVRANINGQFGSFTNWKSNSDIILDMFDVVYSDKAGPSLFGTSGRGSFSRVGVLVRLDGDVGDFMDVLVQDDITGLSSFFINGQGYVEAAS